LRVIIHNYYPARDAKFSESEHPRGQPDNPGQFAASGGGGKEEDEPLSHRIARQHSQQNKEMAARTDTELSEYEHVWLSANFLNGEGAKFNATKFSSREEFDQVKKSVTQYQESYGDNDAYTINQELREGRVTAETKKAIANLDRAFEVLGREMPRDIMVHRSIGDHRGKAVFKVGDIATDAGFTSTTAEKSFAKSWSSTKKAGPGVGGKYTMVSILIPKGSKVLALMGRGGQSEEEILLQHGSKFSVVGIDADGTVNLRLIK
jgi:hypothetical protein